MKFSPWGKSRFLVYQNSRTDSAPCFFLFDHIKQFKFRDWDIFISHQLTPNTSSFRSMCLILGGQLCEGRGVMIM